MNWIADPGGDYLRMIGLFKHLSAMEGGDEAIARIQAIADWNAEYFGMEWWAEVFVYPLQKVLEDIQKNL